MSQRASTGGRQAADPAAGHLRPPAPGLKGPSEHGTAVQRREALALLGAAGTVGCSAVFDRGATHEATVTPLPVPATTSDGRGPEAARETERPRVPPCATVHIHSTRGDGNASLRLHSERTRYRAGTERFAFTLENEADLPFRIGRDRWTLAHRTTDGWSVINRGAATDVVRIQPGGTYRWMFGGAADATTSPSRPRLNVSAAGGHTLAASGSFPPGRPHRCHRPVRCHAEFDLIATSPRLVRFPRST